MKRSSPSLQFLAAAASTDSTTMFSRPPHRGGRNQWRRGFSDRTSGDDGDQFVTGESHFQSVRDANRGFQPVERGNLANHTAFRPPPFNSRQSFNPRPPYNPHPPPFNPRPQFDPPPPPFNQNQQFRPPQLSAVNQNQSFRPPQQFRPRRSKPLDYRNWEYARPGLRPHCERFTVLSYNILADYLAINHRSKLYFHIPRQILDWEWRKRNIIFELGLWSADILCFQEVDRFQDLEEELKLRGYSGIWKMRTGDPVDGCAIFWRISRFKLLHEECIEFNKLGLRDNVAQICVLESMNHHDNKYTSALPTSSTGSNKVVICNIHVLYNPKRGEIKLGQIRVLLDRAHAVSKLWDDAPLVICGDFNCTPKSPLYNFISEQKLNLFELPRDKVSGQASAEIHPPRSFSPNLGAQFADNSVRAPTMVDDKEVRQSDSPLDMQKQNGPGNNPEYVPFMSSLSQPQCIKTLLNVSTSSSINRQHENRDSALSYELTKETQQDAADGCKGEIDPTLVVSVSGLKESPSSSHIEGGGSVDKMKDGSLEFTPMDSHCEDIYSNVIATGHRETVYASSTATSSEHSQSKLYTENESVNCDKRTLSSVGHSYPTDAIIDHEPVSTFKSDGFSSELYRETSFSHALEVSRPGSSGNLSSVSASNDEGFLSTSYEVNTSFESTSIDLVVDEKVEDLSFNELLEARKEDESLGEDCSTFLSELHNSDSAFPSDFSRFQRSDFKKSDESSKECVAVSISQQLHPPSDEFLDDSPRMDSEAVDVAKTTYDPSAWTPMEIETATGSAECTLMEHPLKLSSSYAEVEGCSGTRDSNGEPLVTSYHRCFLGTVDYIWRSEGLQTVRVLAPIPKHAMHWTAGFPTKKWGSDHVALVSELAFTKDVTIQHGEEQ